MWEGTEVSRSSKNIIEDIAEFFDVALSENALFYDLRLIQNHLEPGDLGSNTEVQFNWFKWHFLIS